MAPQVETLPYCKIALHAVKFPHCAVHGLLVGRVGAPRDDASSGAGGSDVLVTDAFPVFHECVTAPPLETALIIVDQICVEKKLRIVGSYFANSRNDDDKYVHLSLCFLSVRSKACFSIDILWAKSLHDKLVANGVAAPLVFRVDNKKLNLNASQSCLVAYTYDALTNKWNTLEKCLFGPDLCESWPPSFQLKAHAKRNCTRHLFGCASSQVASRASRF